MTSDQQVTIISRKYDLSVRRSWQCGLVTQNNGLLVLVGVFGEAVIHADLGEIAKGTVSFEYYWLDRWYNIFQFHEPDGELRNFYCNVSEPPNLEKNVLDYVDFDLDILVWKDFSYEILDLEEFDENRRKFKYPSKIIKKVHQSVSEIELLIQNRRFPFDLEGFQAK